MPDQGHLFAGVRVSNYAEVLNAWSQLTSYSKSDILGPKIMAALNPALNPAAKPVAQGLAVSAKDPVVRDIQDCLGSLHFPLDVTVGADQVTMEFMFYQSNEGGVEFPLKTSDDYTDAFVGAALTSRYKGSVLDRHYNEGGRPEPFPINMAELTQVMDQVHKFWPEAELLIWTEFH